MILWKEQPSLMRKLRLNRKTKLVDVRWTSEEGQDVIISTTRPELICACGIVVVHPDDARYSDLVGKKLTLPVETEGDPQLFLFKLTAQ